MKCPIDGAELVMAERQGVEIDYCPSCRGIWLDRGELDKILDRAATTPLAPPPPPPLPADDRRPRTPPRYDERPPAGPAGYGTGYGREGYGREGYRDGYRQGYDPRRRKKKESWLEDLFDF